MEIYFNDQMFMIETKWSFSVGRLQPTSASPQPFLNFAGPNLESCRGRESCGMSGQLPTSPHCLFRTCFSLGRGLWRDPAVTPPTAWLNLKKMEFQPSLLSLLLLNEGENNEQAGLGWAAGVLEDSSPASPAYSSHVTDNCSFKLCQSLKISATGQESVTIPIFLIFLELERNDEILFLLDVKVIFYFLYLFYFPL